MEKFIIMTIFQPLITSFVLFFFGRRLGVKGAVATVIFFNIFQYIIFWFNFINFINESTTIIHHVDLGKWFYIDFIRANFGFIFDGLSMLMIQLVLTISGITHIYSFFYMQNDPNLIRFLSYLSLFTFFMLILVTADNLALLFTGWEGVGLCSYLLISFWDSRAEARSAGLKAVAINRIGDCFFIMATGILFSLVKSIEFSTIFSVIHNFKNLYFEFFCFQFNYMFIINLFFTIAVIAKSSQIGLHVWLADAMEGPTPVSALIHAATMVTAGIYFILRSSVLFELNFEIQEIIAITGAITAFFGASVAAFQFDVKKIIAYSTCSQLGYMVCACGFGGYKFAFYHLLTHGYFKALLFFSAGLLIHNFKGEQDIRKMGGLFNVMPLTYSFFFVGLSCLMGLPGTSGFDSKEKILDYISIHNTKTSIICYNFLLFALFFTVYYSIKLMYYIFFQTPAGSWPKYKEFQHNFKEAPNFIVVSLSTLALISLFVDIHISDLTTGVGSNFLSSSFSSFNYKYEELFIESFANKNRMIPFFFMFSGFIAFFIVKKTINYDYNFIKKYRKIILFFQKAWYIDYSINRIFGKIFIFCVNSAFFFEKTVCEWIGPYGIEICINAISQKFEKLFNIQKPTILSSISILLVIHLIFIIIITN